MENYKDLLAANDLLMKISPQIIRHSCTYTDEEIFVIDRTGARVSIDGSKDSLNMLIQKMSSKRSKVGKPSKFYEEDRQATMHYKWTIKIKIDGDEIIAESSKFITSKNKAEASASLNMIKKFYELGFLNDYLNYEPQIYQKNKSENQRMKMVKEFNEFTKENKEKGNHEKVIDVTFTYQLNHSSLSYSNEDDETPVIIYFEPKDNNNSFPFKITNNKRWIGFLTDKSLKPLSSEMILFVRDEQYERMHHYLKNIDWNNFIKDSNKESFKFRYQYENTSHQESLPIEFNIKVQEIDETQKDWRNKIKLFHVFLFNMLYTSEASFYKGIFRGAWNFGSQLDKELNLVKRTIMKSKIFNDFSYYDNTSTTDDSLYMFTIPIKNDKIDWDLINSWIEHIKLKILNFANISNVLKLRSNESALYPNLNINNEFAWILKEKLIKTWVYDASSNGWKYLYWDIKPSVELKSSFMKAKKEPNKQANDQNIQNKILKDLTDNPKLSKKERMNFIDFYMHQYAYKADIRENLHWLNRITTPKENVKVSKKQVSNEYLINIE